MGLQPVFWFGVMTIAGSLLTLIMTEWIRVRLERSGSVILFRVLFGSTATLTISLIAFALTRSLPLAVPAWIIIYVLRRAVSPALTIWYNERLDSRIRATMLSFTGQVDALGQVAGGPPIGWLGDHAGIPAALLTSALLLVPALAVFIPLLKERNVVELEGE
jgi:MFS transporter, DHA3 family, tetracycline resistance protein